MDQFKLIKYGLKAVWERVLFQFKQPSQTTIRKIQIVEGTKKWEKILTVAHLHNHESVSQTMNDALNFWSMVGKEIKKGAIFQVVYPNGDILEIELPYPHMEETQKPRLRIVVNNVDVERDP
jgi:hypothetical protein